jgi:beta-glucosidase
MLARTTTCPRDLTAAFARGLLYGAQRMSLRRLGVSSIIVALGVLLALGAPRVAARAGNHGAAPAPRHHRGPIYLDRSYTPAERAADLVARMTLAEKAAEMTAGYSPAIPRLHVQQYGWWNEAAHGLEAEQIVPGSTTLTPGATTPLDNTTSYPDDLALGSTWDPSLVYQQASAISDEGRELAPAQSLDLDFFAPTINLSRDPRWGRNDETFSEDPLLTSDMSSQFVDGFEGKDPSGGLLPQGGGYLKAIATLKHYAANNDEAARTTGSSNMDEGTLRDYYTAQFARTIAQSQPEAIMSAFNSVNGTPASADVHMMQTLARQTYGFDGYFTSDCDAIDAIVAGHRWQPPGYSRPLNPAEARAFANAAGEDLNCNLSFLPLDYQNLLPAASGEGIRTATDTYNVNDMDASLVRLFTARIETGEFDNVNSEPWVKRARAQLGGVQWTNDDSNNAVTETPQRLALAQHVGDGAVVLLKNNPVRESDGAVGPLLPLHVPTSGPFKVAVIGHLAARLRLWLGDYTGDQGNPGIANEVSPYQGIKAAIQAINPSAQVDFYEGFTGPGGVPCTPPACDAANTLTNIDQNAVAAAANYNYVIVDAATDWSTSGEGFDRTSLDLPGAQAQLIQEVAAKNPNTIVAMQTSGDVNVASFASSVPAIVWSSFDGQREGASLADVLLGHYDPSGHLPFTWYQSDSELAPITDYRIEPGPGTQGRTYMYFRGPVSYPFGYGLSYTTFKDSDLSVSSSHPSADDTIQVRLHVTNTGALAGEDLVQLYVRFPGAPRAPRERLEGFRQVYLTPGQTVPMTLDLKLGDLGLWNGHRLAVHDGKYGIEISSSAQNVQLSRSVFVHGSLTPTPSVVTASPQMPGDEARGIQQRVMFPENTLIDPRLTVSMNDESLYGYIHKGASRHLPSGAQVSFTSDNPAVVSVSGDTVRTVSNGVATVTAAVTYNGVTASGQFVVRVLSELSGIALKLRPLHPPHNRKKTNKKAAAAPVPLPGFEPDSYSYEQIVPARQRAPLIVATRPDRRARVRVSQAAGVPGAAHVTVTGPDGIPLSYTIYFARSATSFTGALGHPWSLLNADPAAAHTAGGSLQITPQPGALDAGSARNVLLEPALGDWRIDTKLTLSKPPAAPGQAAGIVAYQDAGDYLSLDWEYGSSGAQLVETTTDSLSGSRISQVLATVPTAGRIANTVWLQMVKHGPRYETFYSPDGVHFYPIYTTGANLTNVKVGLYAVGSGPTASFGYLRVKNSAPVSLH